MKKLLIFLAMLLPVATVSAESRPIDSSALPIEAQQFIQKHFPQQKVVFASIDSGMFDTDYDVRLDNGTKLEFNSKGTCKDAESKQGLLPVSIMPSYVVEYVKANFPTAAYYKIECDNRTVEVEISNGLEITFNQQGKVIEIDD